MWTENYNRNELPAKFDNSNFGEELANYELTDGNRDWNFRRHQVINAPLHAPASTLFTADGEIEERPRYLAANNLRMRRVVTDPTRATLFMPDHAVLFGSPGEETLAAESLWHSNLYFLQWLRNDRTTNWRWRIDRAWEVTKVVSEPVLHCHHRFHFQYFHWVVDVLSRVWAMRKAGMADSEVKWHVGPLDMPFHLPTLALFDVFPKQCVFYPPNSVVHFNLLTVPAFDFLEEQRIRRPDFNSGLFHTGWSTEFISDLRARGTERARRRHGGERIFVARRDAMHRRITNEAEIEAIMEAAGFEILVPGALSFEEQVTAFSNARIIVGIHGAGMTNILWAPAGANVLEIAPLGLWDAGYRFLSVMAGHHHFVIEAEPLHDARGMAFADLRVNPMAFRYALAAIS